MINLTLKDLNRLF